MAKVMVVTSGKGGVGKTTSTAALGAALANSGKNVVLVDFDVGLRNLDLVMGAERRVVYDLINVVQGDAKLAQALIHGARVVPVAGTFDYLPPEGHAVDDGWVGFDPTNNLMPNEQYITVALGRDFADVTPLKGVIYGGDQTLLSVSVDVDRIEV